MFGLARGSQQPTLDDLLRAASANGPPAIPMASGMQLGSGEGQMTRLQQLALGPGAGSALASPQTASGAGSSSLQPPGSPTPSPANPTQRPGMFAGKSSPTYLDDQAPPMTPNGLTALMASPGAPTDNAPVSNVHPKFFQHGGLGGRLLKGLGEFALQYSASQGNPAALATLQNRTLQQRQSQLWAHEDAAHQQEHQWDVDSAAAKARLPEYFMSGKDRVAFDPVTGTSKVVYDGPSDAQDYADSMGYQPGTPDYQRALSDFVLRGNGGTALANKTTLEGVKLDGRTTLEGVRQHDRLQARGTPTYADLHPRPHVGGGGSSGNMPPKTLAGVVAPILSKVASGKPLTPAESQAYDMYRAGRGGGHGRGGAGGAAPGAGGGIPEGTLIRNAQGHTMKRVGGTWVEAR